jgi:hypothetical protein
MRLLTAALASGFRFCSFRKITDFILTTQLFAAETFKKQKRNAL